MKVKELIQDTEWQPSIAYSASQPKISVLLPTYSRAKSGFFQKAVGSILEQTFKDFELIIIDDGSTDGTKQLIAQFMQQDQRISLLTHPHNIGLPAISEYEGFLKAKGDYIIFAFDDFIFEHHAFQSLYEAIHGSGFLFCHGLAKLYYNVQKNKLNHLNFGELGVEHIFLTNTIANASVIIKKEVLHHIGLYDPHLVITRVCDWDLWRRAVRKYPIKKIDVIVGSEYGATTEDSIGKKYHLHSEMASDYMLSDRDKYLLPSVYGEFEFNKNYDHHDPFIPIYLEELLKKQKEKEWFKRKNTIQATGNKKIKIVFCGTETNYFLCFSHYHSSSEHYQIKLIYPSYRLQDVHFFKNADLIIFDRFLDCALDLIYLLKKINIPMYYFIDDNFIELRKEDKTKYTWYTLDNVKQTLTAMSGVLVSTETLKQYFLKHKIHKRVFLYPPVLDPHLLNNLKSFKQPIKQSLAIAIVGGFFRQSSAIHYLIPALNKLNKQIPVILYARKGFLPENVKKDFHYHEMEVRQNFYQYIHHLNILNIDIIVHPAGDTCNISYKTNSVLLSAFYLNTNIIVTEEPAFAGLMKEQGVVKCHNSITGYMDAIQYIRTNNHAKILKYKLRQYCLQQFSSEKSIKILNKITKGMDKKSFLHSEITQQNLIFSLCDQIHELRSALVQTNAALTNKRWLKLFEKPIRSIKSFVRRWYIHYDLADIIQPQFIQLLTYFKNNYKDKKNYFLTISQPINNKMPEAHYSLDLPAKSISEIRLALQGDHLSNGGIIGIEMIVGDKQVEVCHDIQSLNFNHPIVFVFTPLHLKNETTVKIKVFCQKLISPIAVYEFRQKGWQFGRDKILFCSVR